MPDRSGVVIGIDVGGPKKGFHAVALSDGSYLDKYTHLDAAAMEKWCKDVGAQAVGISFSCPSA